MSFQTFLGLVRVDSMADLANILWSAVKNLFKLAWKLLKLLFKHRKGIFYAISAPFLMFLVGIIRILDGLAVRFGYARHDLDRWDVLWFVLMVIFWFWVYHTVYSLLYYGLLVYRCSFST
jgi:hypothetical protein